MKKNLLVISLLATSLLTLNSCNDISNSTSLNSSTTNDSSLIGNQTPTTSEDSSNPTTSIEAEDFSSYTEIDLDTFTNNQTYNINEEGNYVVTGTSVSGNIVVNSTGSVVLALNNANLTSTSASSPLSVTTASSFTLHLGNGTTNYLSDSSSNTMDGVITVKKTNLVIEGQGEINLTSNGLVTESIESGVGIYNSKSILIKEGTINIINHADHAISGKTGIDISGGTINITSAAGDGLHSKEGEINISYGDINITTFGDGIDAGNNVNITGGDIDITTSGTFVLYSSSDDTDGTLSEDAKYIKDGNTHKRISSDDFSRYSSRYYLSQSVKGIKSDTTISITNGTFNITSDDDSIHSNGDVAIYNGNFTLSTKDDGIHAEYLTQIGGSEITSLTPNFSINITSSYEGIEGQKIEIYDGNIDINSLDDGINAAGGASNTTAITESMYLHLGGGCYVKVYASGDGLDANGKITMDGGTVYVFGPTDAGNGALDYDGNFYLTGGTLVAVGASGMAQLPNNVTQYVLGAVISGTLAKGSIVYFGDSSYSLAIKMPKSYSSASVIVSTPNLKGNTAYNVSKNGTYSGTFTDYVALNNGTISGATNVATLTTTEYIVTNGSFGIGGSGSGNHHGGF